MARLLTIIACLHSSRLFGSLPQFKKLDSWGTWLVLLRAIFALPMSDADLEIY
jgi:hypothetical protein